MMRTRRRLCHSITKLRFRVQSRSPPNAYHGFTHKLWTNGSPFRRGRHPRPQCRRARSRLQHILTWPRAPSQNRRQASRRLLQAYLQRSLTARSRSQQQSSSPCQTNWQDPIRQRAQCLRASLWSCTDSTATIFRRRYTSRRNPTRNNQIGRVSKMAVSYLGRYCRERCPSDLSLPRNQSGARSQKPAHPALSGSVRPACLRSTACGPKATVLLPLNLF